MKNIGFGLDFDDVLLVPRPSSVNSRSDVDLGVNLKGVISLRLPIIASPMKGIISTDLIIKISELGGIGLMHRFYKNQDERLTDLDILKNSGALFGVAVGMDNNYDTNEFIFEALDAGAKIICIDVANGYIDALLKRTEDVKYNMLKYNYDALLMAGNVVTLDGAVNLHDAGVDMVRVGIGSGSLCTTRIATGVGMPQLSAINYCSLSDAIIVSDGGIRSAGDIVKALAFGADVVMIGSLFAKAKESANNGIIYGMASRRLNDEYYHSSQRSIEGIEKKVEKVTDLKSIIYDLSWNMRSAFTYLNVKNLRDLRNNLEFVVVNGVKKYETI